MCSVSRPCTPLNLKIIVRSQQYGSLLASVSITSSSMSNVFINLLRQLYYVLFVDCTSPLFQPHFSPPRLICAQSRERSVRFALPPPCRTSPGRTIHGHDSLPFCKRDALAPPPKRRGRFVLSITALSALASQISILRCVRAGMKRRTTLKRGLNPHGAFTRKILSTVSG